VRVIPRARLAWRSVRTVRPGGEFALIERLLAHVPSGSGVLVGPGDDAAVVTGAARMLVTTDMLVEGRHFDLALSSPADVGYKALMVNASDVAAMGGVPRYAVVAAGVPDAGEAAEQLAEGLGEAARELDVGIVGGDTVAAPQVVISIALLGEPGERIVTRAGARPGDALCVTGELGAAAAGLGLWRANTTEARELLERFPGLLRAHRHGRARVREGGAAAATGARAMIDLSDGLLADAGHLCAASGVGLDVDGGAIPLAPGVAEARALLPRLGTGDDYELAIALPPGRVEELAGAIAPTPLTRVGTFTEQPGLRVDGSPAEPEGWDHFA